MQVEGQQRSHQASRQVTCEQRPCDAGCLRVQSGGDLPAKGLPEVAGAGVVTPLRRSTLSMSGERWCLCIREGDS